MITLSVLAILGVVALVLFLVFGTLLSLPLLIVLSLAPWFLAAAGAVLLVKALLEKTSITSGVALLAAAALLHWFF